MSESLCPAFDNEIRVSAPKWGQLLTAEEVASYLKCHVSTVYDLVNRGRLKGLSLTGNIQKNKRGKKGLRILAASVDELIAKGLAELATPVDDPPRPSEAEPMVLPPVKKLLRERGSRVMLPFPGGMS